MIQRASSLIGNIVDCVLPDVISRMSFFFSDAKENPYGEDDNKSPFPLQPKNKRSYAQNVTVWIKPSGLQVTLPFTLLSTGDKRRDSGRQAGI